MRATIAILACAATLGACAQTTTTYSTGGVLTARGACVRSVSMQEFGYASVSVETNAVELLGMFDALAASTGYDRAALNAFVRGQLARTEPDLRPFMRRIANCHELVNV